MELNHLRLTIYTAFPIWNLSKGFFFVFDFYDINLLS